MQFTDNPKPHQSQRQSSTRAAPKPVSPVSCQSVLLLHAVHSQLYMSTPAPTQLPPSSRLVHRPRSVQHPYRRKADANAMSRDAESVLAL